MKNRESCWRVFFGLVLFFLVPGLLPAQGSAQTVEIHGFGGWAFGSTDGNAYSLGTEEGNYDNAQFSLHVVAFPSEALTVVAQVQFDQGKDDVDLDYAFAEWFVSDAFKLRFGRVKHPFGIYGEIFDVGTLRPFQLLPQGIYGGQGTMAEAYNGVGLTGNHSLGARWGLQHDIYIGQITGTVEVPPGLSIEGGLPVLQLTDFEFAYEDVVGARVAFSTPVEGLSIGLSGYKSNDTQSIDVSISGNPDATFDQAVLGAHVEYVGGKTWVRAEVVESKTASDIKQEAFYLETAYKLTPEWQLAARFERWEAELPETGRLGGAVPNFVRQLSDHEELALGLNYWLNPGLVLRLSVHDVAGNRFAFPDDPSQILTTLLRDDLDESTQLIILGTQFSF